MTFFLHLQAHIKTIKRAILIALGLFLAPCALAADSAVDSATGSAADSAAVSTAVPAANSAVVVDADPALQATKSTKCAACKDYEQQVQERDTVAIRVDPGLDPAYEQMRQHHVVPLDLGYAFIGKATLPEYHQAWQRFMQARIEHLKLTGRDYSQPCHFIVTNSGMTIHGPACLPVIGFERIEANFDERGRLSSIMLLLNLTDDTVQDQLRQLLDLRYPRIEAPRSAIAQVAGYIDELNRLMAKLSRQQYYADTSWHQVGDSNYAYIKFSGYSERKKVMMLFGSQHYFTHDEMFLVKRRLAIVRQELAYMQQASTKLPAPLTPSRKESDRRPTT